MNSEIKRRDFLNALGVTTVGLAQARAQGSPRSGPRQPPSRPRAIFRTRRSERVT